MRDMSCGWRREGTYDMPQHMTSVWSLLTRAPVIQVGVQYGEVYQYSKWDVLIDIAL